MRYNLSYILMTPVYSVTKDGIQIGPRFLNLLPEDALDGSSEGLEHLRRARLYHWAALTSGVIAVGLLSGAAISRLDGKQWTARGEHLAGGGVAALFVGLMFGYSRQEELAAAMDAYNYDVLRRK